MNTNFNQASARERALVDQLLGDYNHARHVNGSSAGHYESWFQRANHPTKKQAFWIRYTIFSPAGAPERAIGELWAVYFDGETNTHIAAKSELPLSNCEFGRDRFSVSMGARVAAGSKKDVNQSTLEPGRLRGFADGENGNRIEWDLAYEGGQAPLFNLPYNMYAGSFPKAKILVGVPLAVFSGGLRVNGKSIKIKDWVGSQNHNWGSKHTDHYAWGQVAGFPGAPDTFLEVATARLKFGPIWTPLMTPLILRHRGREYRLNNLLKSFRRGSFDYFNWSFAAAAEDLQVRGEIRASRQDFTCLRYYNPPGGAKFCLNSKVAFCRLELRAGAEIETLETPHTAAFEILTDDDSHGLKPVA